MLIPIYVGGIIFLFFSVLFRFFPKDAPEPYWAKVVVAFIFGTFAFVLSAGGILILEWIQEVFR